MSSTLATVTRWEVSVTFWVSFAFPFIAALIWPWWKSWWGRNIVALEICIAVTLLPSIAFQYFNLKADVNTLQWIQVVALATVPVVVLWRVAMIWYDQRRPDRTRLSRIRRKKSDYEPQARA
jgi:hypothetical protein